MEQTKLKSCPFCGGDAEIILIKSGYKIQCKKCAVSCIQKVLRKPLEWLRGVMIEHWNTRHVPESKSAEDIRVEIFEMVIGVSGWGTSKTIRTRADYFNWSMKIKADIEALTDTHHATDMLNKKEMI